MIKHLYDIFAEKWYHGGSIYFYSDPHFGDLDCYKLRFPEIFSTESINRELIHNNRVLSNDCKLDFTGIVSQLDQMQIDNINKKCGKNDTLVILGDVGNIECIKKLKVGYKVLIMGNHDLGASNYKRIITKSEMTIGLDGFTNPNPTSLYTTEDNHLFDEVYEGTLQIGPKLLLSHEPVDYRYCLNIHGHCHSKEGMFNDINHLNVCAEWIDYKPVCLSGIIKNGYLKDIEDIHRKTIDIATRRKSKKVKNNA